MEDLKKIKIGILTFHRAVNYGAVLQAVALCKTLEALGAQPEILDYKHKNWRSRNSFLGVLKRGGLKKAVEYILVYPAKTVRGKKLNDFVRRNAIISAEQYDFTNISEASKRYDGFIAGSDQIFDLVQTDKDENYYLAFETNSRKKYSYAASMATITDTSVEFFHRYLSDFTAISVREHGIQERIAAELNREVLCHVDPTFLLPGDEWETYVEKPKEQGYILVYTLAKSHELLRFAHQLSQKTGRKIIAISGRAEVHRGIQKVSRASIEEFLGYFKYADLVLTNSFHGTAFSIIMQRNFFVGYHKDTKMGNDRIATLLDVLGLEERATQPDSLDRIDIPIDYSAVNRKIKEEADRGKQYCQTILTELSGES